MLVDAIDTYFTQIKTQMAVVDSSQRFGGLVMARDWPASPLIPKALYLLYMTANPLPGPVSSQTQVRLEHFCQWVWLLIGDDITSSQQGQNRSSRYRENMQIMANLRQAHYPGYTQKLAYTADSQGVVSSMAVTSPESNIEMIHWTMPRFMPRQDEKSGVVYGAASVSVYAWDDALVTIR